MNAQFILDRFFLNEMSKEKIKQSIDDIYNDKFNKNQFMIDSGITAGGNTDSLNEIFECYYDESTKRDFFNDMLQELYGYDDELFNLCCDYYFDLIKFNDEKFSTFDSDIEGVFEEENISDNLLIIFTDEIKKGKKDLINKYKKYHTLIYTCAKLDEAEYYQPLLNYISNLYLK